MFFNLRGYVTYLVMFENNLGIIHLFHFDHTMLSSLPVRNSVNFVHTNS